MKAEELRKQSKEELEQELAALKEQLFKLRFRHATKQLENPVQIRTVKRDIARVCTVLRQFELNADK